MKTLIKNGSIITMDLNLRELADGDGSRPGAGGTARNVVARRMAFFEIRTPRDMLAKAERELERLNRELTVDNVFNFFGNRANRDALLGRMAFPQMTNMRCWTIAGP